MLCWFVLICFIIWFNWSWKDPLREWSFKIFIFHRYFFPWQTYIFNATQWLSIHTSTEVCTPCLSPKVSETLRSPGFKCFSPTIADSDRWQWTRQKKTPKHHVLTCQQLSWLAEVLPLGPVLTHPEEFSKFVYKQKGAVNSQQDTHWWHDVSTAFQVKNKLNVIICVQIIHINMIWQTFLNTFIYFHYRQTFPDQQVSTTLHGGKLRAWRIFLGGRLQCVMLHHDDGDDLKQQQYISYDVLLFMSRKGNIN